MQSSSSGNGPLEAEPSVEAMRQIRDDRQSTLKRRFGLKTSTSNSRQKKLEKLILLDLVHLYQPDRLTKIQGEVVAFAAKVEKLIGGLSEKARQDRYPKKYKEAKSKDAVAYLHDNWQALIEQGICREEIQAYDPDLIEAIHNQLSYLRRKHRATKGINDLISSRRDLQKRHLDSIGLTKREMDELYNWVQRLRTHMKGRALAQAGTL